MASLLPDSERQPPNPDRWSLSLARLAPKPAVSLQVIQGTTSREIKTALDIDTSILKLAAESPELQHAANRFVTRHAEHFVAERFIAIVLRILQNSSDQAARYELQLLRNKAKESGFFIMNYELQLIIERLLSPSFVMAEASGKHPDADHPYNALRIEAADCQCWLPDACENPSEILEMPVEGDECYEDGIIAALRERPWAFAEVKDISTNLAMNDLKLAGAARRRAFHHIETVVNPTRGEYPIEYIGATIGMLKGIVLPDGTEVTLKQLNEEFGVKNERSLQIHLDASSYTAASGYLLRNRVTPAKFNGEDFGILTNWLMCFHKLKRAA